MSAMKRQLEEVCSGDDDSKRFRGSDCNDGEAEGLVVYGRTRKSKGKNVGISTSGSFKEGNLIDGSCPVDEGSKGKCVGNVVFVENAVCDVGENVFVQKGHDKGQSQFGSINNEEFQLFDEGSFVDVQVEDGTLSRLSEFVSDEELEGIPGMEKSRRCVFERALRIEVDVAGELVKGLEAVEKRKECKLEGGEGVSNTSRKSSELKLSRKIVLDQKPTTVRELFETGLLEGVSVIYMGGKKATGLRGTIKDDGILCWCSKCRGHNVISTSQFEVHACKTYKRASEYICFENGKSLLDVLKACRDAPLHMLEATIWNFISSQTQKYFTCRTCKGSFAASSVANIGKICRLCIEAKDCPPNPISASTQVVRSSGLDEMSNSSKQDSDVALKSKRHLKTTIKTPASGVIPESFGSTLACVSIQNKGGRDTKPTSRQPGPKREPLSSASPSTPSVNKEQRKIMSKDQRLHKMVFEEGGLLDGTELAYFAQGKKLIEGFKKDRGIFCLHCNCKVSPSQFESHAGWASRRKPYSYIYTSNGVSLHEFALSLLKRSKSVAKDKNDVCIVCADGGDLVLCNGCPRAFHKDCASLPSVPTGDWYCKYCESMSQSEKPVEHNANAPPAGRVAGPDAIEQVTKKCIRIVKDVEPELSACALCRSHDFNRSVFGPRTSITCDQCEKEFHAGCLREHKMAKLKEIPKGEWFCCIDCKRINSTLNKLLVREAEKIPDPLLTLVQKKLEGKGDIVTNFDVKWKVLKGCMDNPETRIFLSEVVNIFHECFGPIHDPLTQCDLIPSMVYGRPARGQNFRGMYCALLLVNSVVVSAAILRVFGREVAELPLVATRKVDHGKGYFKLLFSCIEKLLSFLNVTCIVVPAAEGDDESIWVEKFGFEKLNPQQVSILKSKCWRMATFKGTCILRRMSAGNHKFYE